MKFQSLLNYLPGHADHRRRRQWRVRQSISKSLMRDILSTPRGRAYVFAQAALAEATDEGAIFDRLEKAVTDPALKKAISKHKADEIRHAALYWDCVKAQGVAPPEIPARLQLLEILREEIGTFDADLRDNTDIMEVYTVLQVIEERALEQFRLVKAALPASDSSHAVLDQVIADEERHLQYCQAAIARVAPSPTAAALELRHYRQVEARAFLKQQERGLAFLMSEQLIAGPKRWIWSVALGTLRTIRPSGLPYTQAAFA